MMKNGIASSGNGIHGAEHDRRHDIEVGLSRHRDVGDGGEAERKGDRDGDRNPGEEQQQCPGHRLNRSTIARTVRANISVAQTGRAA